MKKILTSVCWAIFVSVYVSNIALAKYVMLEKDMRESRLAIEEKSRGLEISPAEEVVEPLMEEEMEEGEEFLPSAEEEVLPIPKVPSVQEEEIPEPVIMEQLQVDVQSREKLEIEEVKNNSYYLDADDIIQVTVLRHPEFSGQFVIEPNGYISLPYVDPIKAKGLTKYQLRDKLIEILSEFIETPKVDVRIVEYNSQVIYVVGAVNNPGKYSTGGKKMTIREAIIAAAMPTTGAALRYAYVFSPDPNKPKKRVELYDLLYRGKVKHNMVLKPGEIIYVRSTVINKLGVFLDQLLNPVQRATAIKYIEEAY